MPSEAPHRLEYIDGLRGLAILGVIMVHAGQLVEGLPVWLRSFAAYGGNGVELFFILSALTLTSISKNRITHWRAFFVRRWFRLAPMFYLGILLYLTLRGDGPNLNAPEGIGSRQVALTFLFLHGWMFDSINSVVPGGWSIANEAMFYLAFPFLLRLLTNGRRAVCAFLAAAILSRLCYKLIPQIFVGMTTPELLQIFASFCFPVQLPAFFGGFVVYYALDYSRRFALTPRGKLAAHIGFSVLLTLLIGLAVSGQKSLANYLLADFLFVPLIVAAGLSQTPLIVNSVMQYTGKISYSLYIVHFAFIDLFKTIILPGMQGLDPALQLAAVFGGVLGLSAVAAAITYRWVEIPTIEWGRALAARFTQDTAILIPAPAPKSEA